MNPWGATYNPAFDRVYVAGGARYYPHDTLVDSTLRVIDCGRDSVVAVIRPGNLVASTPVLTDDGSRLYIYSASRLVTVDCSTNAVTATLPVARLCTPGAYSSATGRLFCSDWLDSVVAIDSSGEFIIGHVDIGYPAGPMALHRPTGRVFVSSGSSSRVAVFRDTVALWLQEQTSIHLAGKQPATLVRASLFFGGRSGSLFDLNGRRVLTLVFGPNDVRRIPAGVYFVRARAGGRARKVVVRR